MDVGIGLFDDAGNLMQASDVADNSEAVESLDAELTHQTPYILGLFFDTSEPVVDFVLRVELADQRLNTPIAVDWIQAKQSLTRR